MSVLGVPGRIPTGGDDGLVDQRHWPAAGLIRAYHDTMQPEPVGLDVLLGGPSLGKGPASQLWQILWVHPCGTVSERRALKDHRCPAECRHHLTNPKELDISDGIILLLIYPSIPAALVVGFLAFNNCFKNR